MKNFWVWNRFRVLTDSGTDKSRTYNLYFPPVSLGFTGVFQTLKAHLVVHFPDEALHHYLEFHDLQSASFFVFFSFTSFRSRRCCSYFRNPGTSRTPSRRHVFFFFFFFFFLFFFFFFSRTVSSFAVCDFWPYHFPISKSSIFVFQEWHRTDGQIDSSLSASERASCHLVSRFNVLTSEHNWV